MKRQLPEPNDIVQEQPNSDNNVTPVHPDFGAYDDLWERKAFTLWTLVRFLAECSASKLAVLCTLFGLCYLAVQVVTADEDFTYVKLIGTLAIALMLAGVGITVFLVGQKCDAKNCENTPDAPAQLGNEPESPRETRESSRSNRS